MREATPADASAIRALNDAAFGKADESALIEQLRADGDMLFELVEDANDGVLGHIAFSRLRLHGPSLIEAAALAPMSVRPDRQNSGVGGALIRAGLAECRRRNLAAVIVLGHPAYYPRFGFTAEAARTLHAPFSGPAFMALELADGALSSERTAEYAPAFGLNRLDLRPGDRET